jgi:hypothetical protein
MGRLTAQKRREFGALGLAEFDRAAKLDDTPASALHAGRRIGYAARAVRQTEIMPKKLAIPAAQRAAIKVIRARADERAAKLAPIIKALRAKGVTSLSGIAAALNKRRIRTPRGVGQWQATQVRRVLARLPA